MTQSKTKPALIRLNVAIFIGLPVAALLLVPAWGIYRGFDTVQWLWALAFLYLNGMSITGGYHRLWAHKSYEASPVLKWLFAFWGAGALQNSILVWASDHRRHHRHVDDNDLDPYSAGRGLWFSHMGWMLRHYRSSESDFSNARDLQRDPVVMWQAPPLCPPHPVYEPGAAAAAGYLARRHNRHPVAGGPAATGDQPPRDVLYQLAGALLGLAPLHRVKQRPGQWLSGLSHLRRGLPQFPPYLPDRLPQRYPLVAVGSDQVDDTTSCSRLGLAGNLNRVPDFKIQRALLDTEFERARAHLEHAQNSASLREVLEREYQEFTESINQWTALQAERYGRKKEQLGGALEVKKLHLQQKWEHAALRTRLKELEYSLKMQRKRLGLLMQQLQLQAQMA